MTKVLVFESDAQFAESLKTGLAGYGCDVVVVDDGEVGIAEAEKNKPELILLAIELPRMNGFSVCNKLKRAASLKDVPLILMSTEATEETFEQHKRLRTRAEDYVHKPITVADLVGRIRPLVQLDGPPDSISDEVTIEVGSSALEAMDETDAAFGNLIAKAPSIAPESPKAPPPPAEEVIIDELELDPDDGVEIAEPDAPPQRVAPVSVAPPVPVSSGPSEAVLAELEELRGKVRELALAEAEAKEKLKQADESLRHSIAAKDQLAQKKDAELDLLQKEVEELKTKVASNQGAGSAREFLDLREQLNKKDKELIEIRDQLTSHQREVVKLNDSNIALERDKADLSDKVRELETAKTALEKTRDALTDDKAQANKRADDFKSKSERLTEELANKVSELKAAKEAHESTIAQRDAADAVLREDHKAQLAQSLAQAKQEEELAVQRAIEATRAEEKQNQEAALQAAAVDAEKAQRLAIATRETELRAEHDSKMAALHRANEESLRKLKAEHQQALDEAAQKAQDQLLAREKELKAERDEELAAQSNKHQAAYQQLSDEKAASEAARDAQIASVNADLKARTSERDAALQTIEQRDGRVAQLEAELLSRGEELATAVSTIAERDASLSATKAELASSEAALASEKATVVERDGRIAKLEVEVAGLRAELVQTSDKLASESALLTQARAKWQTDQTALQAAKQALAQATGELDGALGRSMP